jgi:hypothetical protein
MTCQQFFRMATERHPFSLTRAERAVMDAHVMRCRSCLRGVVGDAVASIPSGAVIPPEVPILAHAQLAEDRCDPEYREVVEKGRKS